MWQHIRTRQGLGVTVGSLFWLASVATLLHLYFFLSY